MSSRIQQLLAAPSESGIAALRESRLEPGVMALSADVGFYAKVLSAANPFGWRTVWARWLERAIDVYKPGSTPIIVYDVSLPGTDWIRAFDRLCTLPGNPRILLASVRVDEEVWRIVLQRHGYDVVPRSSSPEELMRALHFAWLSLQPRAASAF